MSLCMYCGKNHVSESITINTVAGSMVVKSCPLLPRDQMGMTLDLDRAPEWVRSAAEAERKAAYATKQREEAERERRRCFECHDHGKHRCETTARFRCDRCELQHVRERHEHRRRQVIELVEAILPGEAERVRLIDDTVPEAITKVKLMREECETPQPDPIWIAAQLSGINSVVRGENMSGKALAIIQRQAQEYMEAATRTVVGMLKPSFVQLAFAESGPGLAARYPDATRAAKPEAEIVTCDLGADYD